MIEVYVLKSEVDERLYVGMTNNLSRRIKEHNGGFVRSTKGFRPWKLVLNEAFKTRKEARTREKYLKSGFGKSWLKKKITRSHSSAG